MSVSASTFRPPAAHSSAGTQPPLAIGRFTTVLIRDPRTSPPLEERHVTILPRSPLDTLRLLWREGHVKDLGLTALTGAVATISAYFSATADDDTVRAANGATGGFTGALSLAGLSYSIKGIRATLARDDHQRAEPARRAKAEYLESMEQWKEAVDRYHELRLEAQNLPVEGRRLVTSTQDGKGNTEVTVFSLEPIECNPVTGRRIEPDRSAADEPDAEGREGLQGEVPEGDASDSSSSAAFEASSDAESFAAGELDETV